MITIDSKKEDLFADIILGIENFEKDSKGDYSITAKGKYKDKIVGINLIVKNSIRKGIVNGVPDNTAFEKEGIVIKSIGNESDRFINALAELYAVEAAGLFFGPEIAFTCFALQESDLDIEHVYTRFKVFHDENNVKDQYAELYVNINVPNGEVEISEKDIEYRKNIIAAFSNNRF